MAYSNRKIADDPTLFPPVQTYMTWIEDVRYTSSRQPDGTYKRKAARTGEGKLRHYYTLADAKRGLMWVGSKSKYVEDPGRFRASWALYHWDGDAWAKLYSGEAGESRDRNPLFKRKLSKDEKKHPIDDAVEQAAVRSIMEAMA